MSWTMSTVPRWQGSVKVTSTTLSGMFIRCSVLDTRSAQTGDDRHTGLLSDMQGQA